MQNPSLKIKKYLIYEEFCTYYIAKLALTFPYHYFFANNANKNLFVDKIYN